MVDQGDLFYCAGALMVEDPLLAPFIERIEGSMDSVQGLSKAVFLDLVEQLARRLDDVNANN
jgi:septum formation protein